MTTAPPSRRSNPFASCWTRPDAVGFVDTAEQGVDDAVNRLEAAAWRGQIVGPHGAGKSTLMAAMAGKLRERGVDVSAWRPEGSSRRRRDVGVVLLDGFERLGRGDRRTALAACARSGHGWLLTTHRAVRDTAVVAKLAPSVETAVGLFRRLTAELPTPVTIADVRHAFAARGGNLRDVWLDLYVLHEARSRGRTAPVTAAYC